MESAVRFLLNKLKPHPQPLSNREGSKMFIAYNQQLHITFLHIGEGWGSAVFLR